MSAFLRTKYKIRLQLIDENNKVVESYLSPDIIWLDAIEYFKRVHKTKWINEMKTEKKPNET